MSRLLEFQYHIQLQFECPVTGHSFCLRCMPPDLPGQIIRDLIFHVEPGNEWSMQRDGFGNRVQAGLIAEPHNCFSYSLLGTAEMTAERETDNNPLPVFRYPSALTGISPAMKQMLDTVILPVDEIERAEKIMNIVRENLSYVSGKTNVCTSAAESFASGYGVCQDFAHIFLAMARYAGLTARYINGLTTGATSSHAWCQVWVKGKWIGIDPTRGNWTDDSYLVFNRGRDYNDCPIERGVFKGFTQQVQTISVTVTEQ